ncbi:MAG: hypothetical protein IKC82_02100 [Lentisphaeria bacterium]|nr:hypothetical protein [Lentisphaeria bacterium]
MDKFRYILRYYIDPGYDEDTRIAELLDFCQEGEIDDVMLFFNAEEVNNGHITKEELAPWLVMAKKIKNALASIGVTMSVNPWTTTLHVPRGRKLKKGQENFTLMVGETGENNGVTTCPLCENWLAYICSLWSMVAGELHPSAIWIEDDWRLFNHGDVLGRGGCFCEKHLAELGRRVGRKVTRKEVLANVYGSGDVHPWRKELFEINRRAMSEPLAAIRQAVQQASPETRIGLMCGTVDSVSQEGARWAELQDAAGFDPAFLVRPTLYPYTEIWPMLQFPVPARLIIAALKRPLDIAPELETGPRHGAYSKGNAFAGWELEQCAAIGAHNVTINHFDMLGCGCSTAPGFARMLKKKKPRLNAVKTLRLDDDDSIGANILFSSRNAEFLKAGANGGKMAALANYSDEWGRVGAILGFSFRFTEKIVPSGQVTLVSGQTLNAFSDDEVKRLLAGGVILDAIAAETLIDRGMGRYLGLSSYTRHHYDTLPFSYEEIPEEDVSVYGVRNPRMTLQRACREIDEFTVADAEVKLLSNIRRYDHQFIAGGVFAFDNELGGRVLTLAYALGDRGESEWFYMGFFNPFRRIFIQKLLRFAAPETAIAFAEEFPFQMHRVSCESGEFFAAVNATSDDAEKVVIAVFALPEGRWEVLDGDGNWQADDRLEIILQDDGRNGRIIWHGEVEALNTLIFRCRY